MEDNEYCEKHCKGYRDTGGRCFADGRCDAYWKYQKQKGTMRKAKITGCMAKAVGIEMTNAAIGVAFVVGRYERYVHVVFPIEIAKTYIDRNINQKSELLTERLMKYVREELDHWNEGDADTTDLENILRLKMPFLLRKAVNMEYFTQRF